MGFKLNHASKEAPGGVLFILLQGNIATAHLNNRKVLQQEVASLPAQGFTAYGTSGFGWAYFDNLLIQPSDQSVMEVRNSFYPEPVLTKL